MHSEVTYLVTRPLQSAVIIKYWTCIHLKCSVFLIWCEPVYWSSVTHVVKNNIPEIGMGKIVYTTKIIVYSHRFYLIKIRGVNYVIYKLLYCMSVHCGGVEYWTMPMQYIGIFSYPLYTISSLIMHWWRMYWHKNVYQLMEYSAIITTCIVIFATITSFDD